MAEPPGANADAAIAWSPEFEVGHKELDRQHFGLVEAVNAVYRAAKDPSARKEVGRLLDGVLDLTRDHFKHENSVLLQIGRGPIPMNTDRLAFIVAVADAVLDQHVASHARAFRDLASIAGEARKAIEAGAPLLAADLKEWFVNHMAVHDARLRPIFAAVRRG